MKNKKGFTLIELLVVVLIIGILASVALPQYQKAVVKSRFAEAFSNLKTIAQADEVCRMSGEDTGSYGGCRIDELSIEIPGEKIEGRLCGEPAIETKNFYYWASNNCDGPEAAAALYKEEDVCVCLLKTGQFAIRQNDQCRPQRTSFDYAKLLKLPEDIPCACC